jgi:sporulation protein YlmC with PRC-barrel domain
VTAKRGKRRQRADGVDPGSGERATVGRNGWSDNWVGFDRLAADAQLRSAHGFLVDTVDGREVGVVEDVTLDPATGRVARLEVCGGWFGRRRRMIAVDEISMIFPRERRITVAPTVVDPFGR